MQGRKGIAKEAGSLPALGKDSLPLTLFNPLKEQFLLVGRGQEGVNSSHKSTAFTGKISRKHPIDVSH